MLLLMVDRICVENASNVGRCTHDGTATVRSAQFVRTLRTRGIIGAVRSAQHVNWWDVLLDSAGPHMFPSCVIMLV